MEVHQQPLVHENGTDGVLIPKRLLYEHCLQCYIQHMRNDKQSPLRQQASLEYLPASVLIDLYEAMSQHEDLVDLLFEKLSSLEIFYRLLRYQPARQKLFNCMARVTNRNKPLALILQQNFVEYIKKEHHQERARQPTSTTTNAAYMLATLAKAKLALLNRSILAGNSAQSKKKQSSSHKQSADEECREQQPLLSVDAIDLGLRLGTFLDEAGWLSESIGVLSTVAQYLVMGVCLIPKGVNIQLVRLDCLRRLLHAESTLSNFKSAERTFLQIKILIKSIREVAIPLPLLITIYTVFSEMFFARHEYKNSYTWSSMAIENLQLPMQPRIIVDVIRQAAKVCVVKRAYHRAHMLISLAKYIALCAFGYEHQKYANTLQDYGFFLLNADAPVESVMFYDEALAIISNAIGDRNFHVASIHEDLSYVFYVNEYSSGIFFSAQHHVEKAVDIMKNLLPSNHIKLASTKRVKALYLEEIALDKISDGEDDEGLLKQSENLHMFALEISLDVFGEMNVQTAKLYGNLGRLYQSMNRLEEAEQMHQKAIYLKTLLLGPYDSEVGLSMGHLASLYNYQMGKYREAETLYLRSIEISLRLFGEGYSGLQYDYLGICHVYETLEEYDKYLIYAHILDQWHFLRSEYAPRNKFIIPYECEKCNLEEVKTLFSTPLARGVLEL